MPISKQKHVVYILLFKSLNMMERMQGLVRCMASSVTSVLLLRGVG